MVLTSYAGVISVGLVAIDRDDAHRPIYITRGIQNQPMTINITTNVAEIHNLVYLSTSFRINTTLRSVVFGFFA